MRWLIIGAGYVGKAVAAFQKALGHEICCTTRSPDKIPSLQPFGEVILWSHASLEQVLQPQDVILFCVAPDTHHDYKSAYLDNALQIRKVLKDAKLIYTSSTSVYEEAGGAEVDESSPLKAHVLAETENVLLTYPHTSILRLGEIVGPGRQIHQRLAKGMPLAGTGQNFANLSHLDDIVRGIDWVVKKERTGVYNLCADLHPTRRELYEQIALKYQLEPIQWDPNLKAPHGSSKKVISEKIKDAGFTFTKNTLSAFI